MADAKALMDAVFQSTLPARGATFDLTFTVKAWVISIHAPRTGSDLAADADVRHFAHISIHAPRTGSDGIGQVAFAYCSISIHAPRTGSDGG